MNKLRLRIIVSTLMVLLFTFMTGGSFLSAADKQRIDLSNIQNPQSLVKVLNGMDTEIDALRTLANELKADYNLLRTNLLTGNFTAGVLAEGTNANTIKTGAAVNFAIDGYLYTKAATDNIAMTACTEQAVSTYCLYLVSSIANGTITITKGTSVATDTAVLPDLPASSAAIGYFKVVTDADTTFTSGTDDITTFVGSGGAVTFYDMVLLKSGTGAATAITSTTVTEQTTRGK